uniref:Uncharacterized protein n=1 Tax=Anopheles dirus TaxID=7168 RepID=A0A182NKZ6_9DIPT
MIAICPIPIMGHTARKRKMKYVFQVLLLVVLAFAIVAAQDDPSKAAHDTQPWDTAGVSTGDGGERYPRLG